MMSKGTTEADSREAKILQKVSKVLDEYGLTPMGKSVAMAYLRHLQDDDMSRVRKWWLRQLNGKGLIAPPNTPEDQRGCPEILEDLRGEPFWNLSNEVSKLFPWIKSIEEAAPTIRAELVKLRDCARDGFQPYRSVGKEKLSTDAGAWNVFYLDLHNYDCQENRQKCPKTIEILDSIPRKYGHAFFSATAPGTHITPHHGPTNKKLRCQLPLFCPPDACRLRVASVDHILVQDKALIFDDSFQHEAWNMHPSKSRLVLVFDVWHPDLSDREIKFLSFLQNAALRKAKKHADRSLKAVPEELDSTLDHTSSEDDLPPAPPPSFLSADAPFDKSKPVSRDDNFYAAIEKGRREGVRDRSEVWSI